VNERRTRKWLNRRLIWSPSLSLCHRHCSKRSVSPSHSFRYATQTCLCALQANKMVRTERIRRAETEEELREARLEREALKSALRVVESENGRLRRGHYAIEDDQVSQSGQSRQSGDDPRPSRSRSSSCVGVKSRSSSSASIRSLKLVASLASSTTYPPSPPPEPSHSVSPSTPLASTELTPQDMSRFSTATTLVSDEQLAWANLKPKPQPLHADSLFPMPPLFST
jgi:hypothetical protein